MPAFARPTAFCTPDICEYWRFFLPIFWGGASLIFFPPEAIPTIFRKESIWNPLLASQENLTEDGENTLLPQVVSGLGLPL